MVDLTPLDPFAVLLKDGNDNPDAARDFSGGETSFSAGPDSDEIWILDKLVIVFIDMLLTPGRYGNQLLTNGIQLLVKSPTGPVQFKMADEDPVKSTEDLATMAELEVTQLGMGEQQVQAILELKKDIRLNGANGIELVAILADDFSGLNFHQFRVHGSTRAGT